jgi:DivIVA domain-containing protein
VRATEDDEGEMKKKDTTSEGASEWSSTPKGRITPGDVQQKEFRVARFGAGYRVREVDEFLDQVTDALSALIEENESLLRGDVGRAAASSPPSVRPTTDDSDRAAVDVFLRREKGFLQDLGGLVQAHAEELRTMIRAVRRDAAPSAAEEAPPAEAPRGVPAATPVVAPEARIGSSPEATPGAMKEADAPPEEASTDPEAIEATQEQPSDAGGDDREAIAEQTATITGDATDEPIRLEDPEPARSRRSDEEEGGSLRELFWGEE